MVEEKIEEAVDYGKVTGMVHSTESFGAVDGPGIRFIVFLQGCHMRCQYCHNPDTWEMETNKSQLRTVDDVLQEALRYKGFWGNKGGITVSGGEALLQIDFLIAFFTKAKELGIPYKLEGVKPPTADRVKNAKELMQTESYTEYMNRVHNS